MLKTAAPVKCFPFPNGEVAAVLEQVAVLLEIQAAGYYRIRAYREAAQTIRSWAHSVVDILQTESTPGLEELPRVGKRLAAELGKTRDWVVIYYERKGRKGQCTVVTETRGIQRGDRVVRRQDLPLNQAVPA